MSKRKKGKRVFEDDEILTRNNDDYMFTEVDGEAVAMNVNTGTYFGLNSVTTDIWHFFEEDMDYNNVIKKLVGMYDVDEKTCREDTRIVIARMIAAKLITKKQ